MKKISPFILGLIVHDLQLIIRFVEKQMREKC